MSLIVAAPGCQSTRMSHGVPNLAEVGPGVWRGGQPTAEGWVWLGSMGVTDVVKLNTEAEGSDAAARALGMTVHAYPIPFGQQMGFQKIPAGTFELAVSNLAPRVFIHCSHGQDRTGLAVACYRIQHGWLPADAEAEMLAHGFHKELVGLWDYWKRSSAQ